jgi:hypothetical protein
MKKNLIVIAGVLCTMILTDLHAQAPDRLTYQTVVRDTSGALVVNTSGILRLSVLQGGPSGTAVYTETQTTQTDGNGLLQTTLGSGTVTLGQLDTIDWSGGPYFLKVEVGPEGGTEYVEAGVSQLLSVPYVLHSTRSGHVPLSVSESGDTVYIGKGYVIAKGASAANAPVPPSVPADYPSGYVHCGSPTEVIAVTNPLTGKTWMDRNLGASRAATLVATEVEDSLSYGALFQWGRFADGHQCRNSGTTSTLSSSPTPGDSLFIVNSSDPYNWLSTLDDNLWQGVSGVNNPCPGGYRIPTLAEWEDELGSWGSEDSSDAFQSPLKLPVSGRRDGSNGDIDVGSVGYYWSSSVEPFDSEARGLGFDRDAALGFYYRTNGYAVRCLKD